MSTVTLRDALDDLERSLAAIRAAKLGPARSGGRMYAEEDDEEDDLFGEDDLGFDDIDEDDDEDLEDDELDPDLEELDDEDDADDEP
jgi:hypothetical protein